MELIDAHCHFDFPQFDGRRPAVLAEAGRAGISRLVVPGVRRADWDRVVDQARQFSEVFYCLGIHPWFVTEHHVDDLDELRDRLRQRDPRCVGVGECGLDRLRGPLADQMEWFERQVALAIELDLPLVVHSVRCHDEVASVLRRQQVAVPVLVHGFAGSYEQAVRLVDLGCYIGVGGVITYSRASKTRNAIARLPLASLVLETDAPDMPPAGVAQGDNSPVRLPGIFEELSELRAETSPQLGEALLANTRRLYRWS
ncbi:TatD family hydrolase [Marinobacter sp. SS21]|uniref:TatD family hydrolase n=1 Tax=Marinobacter sp. SS21 TaxID=2979460 RepID=UPI0023306E9A|nr:TatD family hydrolase [Marinobacter sp. SS21]MDC0664100.1 TatD family hydrolase [Marinobacter sp. SS21]